MSENNLKEVWNLALDQIEKEYKEKGKEIEFKLWFKMTYLEDNIQTIKVSVPSEFMWKQMISKGIINTVKNTIKNLMGLSDLDISPVINDTPIAEEKSEPLQKKEIIKENSVSKEKNESEKTISQIKRKRPENTTLDPEFNFETFIPGEGSTGKFAYNVAMAIADNP